MARRSGRAQTRHDAGVRRQATKLKRAGWCVQADTPGYPRPDGIGRKRRRPDVVGNKGCRRKIVEVETPASLLRDQSQQSTFRRSAACRPNTTFHIVVARPSR